MNAGYLAVNYSGCVEGSPSAYHGGHVSLSEVATLIYSETIRVESLSESEILHWSPTRSKIKTSRVIGVDGVIWSDASHVFSASPNAS